MDENFDELGNYVGPAEYSDSDASELSDRDGWEDVNDSVEDNALVKSVYGPNVEVAHYKHDTQDARTPLVAPERHSPLITITPENWEFHKGLMDTAPGLVRNIAIVGHINHGKSSFVEMFMGKNSTDTTTLEKQRGLTLKLSCHTTLVQDSQGKSFVLNIADTPGHVDFYDEVQASRVLADNSVLVVDAVEGPVLPRFTDTNIVIVNKIDRLILDLRLSPGNAFDRLRVLIEDELAADPERVIFMSTKFQFAFTLKSFSSLYSAYQDADEELDLWNSANFTSFVLKPLYKLFSCGLLGPQSQKALASLGITLSHAEWHLGYNDRIKLILSRFFEDPMLTSVVDVLVKFTRPAQEVSSSQIVVAKRVRAGNSILALVRVNSGHISCSSSRPLYIPYGTRVIEAGTVHSGNWALIETDQQPDASPVIPLVKIGIEALHDSLVVSERFASGLETVSSLYPALRTQIMETGEYCFWGTGELYLDCVVNELKTLIDPAFRIGQPCAELRETVSEPSYVACPTKIATVESSITILASPLPPEIVNEIEGCSDVKKVLLKYGWSLLDADSIWATYKGNVLSDDSVPPLLTSVDSSVREALIQGFEWACTEGPLMEAPLRGVHFKVMEGIFDGTVQLIPAVRRACHAAMFVASPRIMEPWMRATMLGPLSAGKVLYSQLAKRRGKVDVDRAVVGTNLYITEGTIPLMDAFGFEIDVLCNVARKNEAQLNLTFDSWRVVEGDPLDNTVSAPRLKPAGSDALARDYMIKTRRRKGLIAEPNLERYLDEDVASAILK